MARSLISRTLSIVVLSILQFSPDAAATETQEDPAAGYYFWTVDHLPYKARASQLIDEYNLLNKVSFPPLGLYDDFIMVVSKNPKRGLRMVWYGNQREGYTFLTRAEAIRIFSETFLRKLMDRKKYSNRNFLLQPGAKLAPR